MNTCAHCHKQLLEGIKFGRYSPGVSEKRAVKGAKVSKLIEEFDFCNEDHLNEWFSKEYPE